MEAADKTAREFARFQIEMATLGIQASWRVADPPPFHDRFRGDKGPRVERATSQHPPKGDYSEIRRSEVRPPLETWWKDGKDLA